MALDAYLQKTQLLLNDAGFTTFNPDDLRTYVNIARGQIANQTECLTVIGMLAVTAASQLYTLSAITGLGAGVQAVINVRNVTYNVGQGQKYVHSRPWPHFERYILSQAAPIPEPPAVWTQYGRGTASSIYINLLDQNYTLNMDSICQPSDLNTDTDPETLSFPYTDAVPWFSAYQSAYSAGNMEAAKRFFDEYQRYLVLATGGTQGPFQPDGISPLSEDPYKPNRLGLASRAQGA